MTLRDTNGSQEQRQRLRERKNRERRARTARLAADPSIAPHGKLNTYNNYGCRCPECTGAYMDWHAIRAMKRRPRKRKLPDPLVELQNGVDPELARLIQEQYDDDCERRAGYAQRLPNYDTPLGVH